MSDGNWSWEQTIHWLRAQPDQAVLVQDGYYDDPIEVAAARYWNSAEWQHVKARLSASPAGRALDFGAGRGIASYALARSGYTVVALERDASALVGAGAVRALARRSNLPIEVREDDSERLSFDDGCFDLVFGRAVLHHVLDLEGVCREFYRVLRPGGTLVVIREHVISRESDLEAFRALHPLHKYYGGENAYTLARYTTALKAAGFELQEVIRPLRSPINLFPYSMADVQAEVARRLSGGSARLARVLAATLRQRWLWSAALPFIELADRRPGRLYSFMARRP